MTAHRVLGVALAAVSIVVLVADITAWPAFILCGALWAAFAVSVAMLERREQADRDQADRICQRANQEAL